jgi:hypothetical protein
MTDFAGVFYVSSPQSSFELPNWIILTLSPYFSPNKAIAPLSKAS